MVVFDSVSRMSRNAEEGFALYEDLYHKGIRLVFLKEHHIDTETYKKALSGSIAMTGTNVDFILKGINEYLMALAKEQIKLAFEQSEKEVAELHQRTREGLLTARLNGKQVGRKKGVGFETKKAREAKQIIRTHCKTFGGDRYYENDKATAFDREYANGLSFVGILPVDEGDFTLEDLDIGGLLKSQPEYDEVQCKMPKLDFETTAILNDILSSLGLDNIFSSNADFSGIADKNVNVDTILQKTKLELDENGTKAAAVTAIFTCRGGGSCFLRPTLA